MNCDQKSTARNTSFLSVYKPEKVVMLYLSDYVYILVGIASQAS